MSNDEHVKVAFRLEKSDDGFPPVSWEGLWGVPMGVGKFRIDNIPFYVKLVSCGDIVLAVLVNRQWIFQETLVAGGHSTIRILFYAEEFVQILRSELAALGCSTELSNVATLIAVDVPPHANYVSVIEAVSKYADMGLLDYEEASIQH